LKTSGDFKNSHKGAADIYTQMIWCLCAFLTSSGSC